MPQIVDFRTVSEEGLESSPVAPALAGLRANEARYFANKYDHVFTVSTPAEDPGTLAWVEEVLRSERDIEIASPALQVSGFEAGGIRFGYVFYESGLAINVMYTIEDGGKRAVGFKLSEGVPVPEELEGRFRFARQRSKLAGEIRGSYFVIRGEH
ncbi:phage tail protein [Leucobacter sp. CSA2]|uniref:Phage tail protein n=1 Tax=Leucobacter edaphi TaxID=2796472 RepID=A0A934UVX8_9MICO|nr:phage tail protein [Leucobacter edaphi]MBK0421054.1 phage tail protein [Leucobacter edaphi]